ncbi:transcriptional regulator with XRE-family HTH domain [Brevundimonas bullata]|uniref:Transcriptional regulator with XRE-family HTH domain n=1 Tax=Brevundimonas bullata TaxID=13160 RepID=A0A7W7IQV8_9CAUL|nr:helix-turn-helix transcriptional regulator [Brevundimonas bullata]MBB4798375.1 transcriptional regulator with XRE-family HTH domain [Brevundimonas bullata]MBB6383311.1 transcriptional regulator with XRE-family HTH domain [Brevundimonas bullata]
MLKTPLEIQHALAERLKARRVALGWTQQVAAQRAGIAYRTWRRLENEGKASFEDVIKSAVALRCEGGLEALFPQPAATSLDDLLKQQAVSAAPPARVRARKSHQS